MKAGVGKDQGSAGDDRWGKLRCPGRSSASAVLFQCALFMVARLRSGQQQQQDSPANTERARAQTVRTIAPASHTAPSCNPEDRRPPSAAHLSPAVRLQNFGQLPLVCPSASPVRSPPETKLSQQTPSPAIAPPTSRFSHTLFPRFTTLSQHLLTQVGGCALLFETILSPMSPVSTGTEVSRCVPLRPAVKRLIAPSLWSTVSDGLVPGRDLFDN